MNRRFVLGAAAGALVIALALLLYLLSREKGSARPTAIATAPSDARATHDMLAPGSAAPSTSSDAGAVEMPEGLAQDLAIFNSDQLRAELESIALSYPAVGIIGVSCDAKPCIAEVQIGHERDDDELAALDAFLDQASKRFQGYLTATFREVTTPSGEPAIRAVLVVGGDAPRAVPKYGHSD